MKNKHTRRSQSWASHVIMVILGLLAVMAMVAGAGPVNARIMIDDGGDDGGGGGDGGGGEDSPGSCLDNVSGTLTASRDFLIAGQSTTLSWSASVGTCATLKLVTSTRREWPLTGSTGQVTKVPLFNPNGTEQYDLVASRAPSSKFLARVTIRVQTPPTVTISEDNQVGVFLYAITIPWQIIVIQNHVNLDLSYRDNLYIAPGVKIIGGRSPTEPGPRLFTTTFPSRLFYIGTGYEYHESDNVRISGIRLQGAEMGSADADASGSTGITIYSSVHIEIDNNELFGWRGSAVNVRDPFNRLNGDNYDAVRVHDNYIHHNQHDRSEGYGVSLHESAYTLIEKNVFNYNRHAIAAEGTSLTGYYALSNLVFGGGGLGNSTFNTHTHMFDVHGSESCYNFGYYCGNAGEHFEFRSNTILYDHGTAIKVRGKPSLGAIADANVFRHPDEWGGYLDDAALAQNAPGHNFYSTNNTFGAHFDDMRVRPACDFNGDGLVDDFLATGATWWYYPATVSDTNRSWRYLNTVRKRRSEITLADVNSDGVCDVRDNRGIVYLGGTTKVPPPPSSLPLVPDVRGITSAEATSALVAAGFVRGVLSYAVDTTCNNIGLVRSQNPTAGTPTTAGTAVNLSIGTAPSTACP